MMEEPILPCSPCALDPGGVAGSIGENRGRAADRTVAGGRCQSRGVARGTCEARDLGSAAIIPAEKTCYKES